MKASEAKHQSYIDVLCNIVQVMSLRDENEKLMDVLVQTKVELAESQGISCQSKSEGSSQTNFMLPQYGTESLTK